MTRLSTVPIGPCTENAFAGDVQLDLAPSPGSRCTSAELLVRQVLAVDSWNAARRRLEALLDARPQSRESRLNCRVQSQITDRVHAAICQRTALALAAEPAPLFSATAPRVVLAHRHPWILERLALALGDRGIDVLARVDNGPEALGIVVAEQPDGLISGERLAMMSGAQLVREASLHAPSTHLVARPESSVGASDMQAAGARLSRRTSPSLDQVADELVGLLNAPVPQLPTSS